MPNSCNIFIIIILYFILKYENNFDYFFRRLKFCTVRSFTAQRVLQASSCAKSCEKNISRFSQAAARSIITDHADKRVRLHLLLDGLALRIRCLADSPSKVLKQQKMKQVRDRDIDGLFMDIHDAGGLEEISNVLTTLEHLFDGWEIN